MRIPVLYSTDKKAFEVLKVSIYSLLTVKNKSTNYDITIAYIGFGNKYFKQIKDIVALYPGNTVRFINCKQFEDEYHLHSISNAKNNPLHIKWPSPMYYYFFANQMYKNTPRVIYLDTDTVVMEDLTKLYQYPSETAFTCVKEFTLIHWFIEQNKLYKANKLPKKYYTYDNFLSKNPDKFLNYPNSGVLLINLDELAKFDMHKIFVKAHEKHLPDQDIIGLLFEKDITNCPLKWNYCIHYFQDFWYDRMKVDMKYDYAYTQKWGTNANILHYTVRPKPAFFYNENLLPLIMEVGGLSKYNHLLRNPRLALEISHKSRLKMIRLSKAFHEKIMNLSNKCEIYEQTFYQYGLIWKSMINKLKDKLK